MIRKAWTMPSLLLPTLFIALQLPAQEATSPHGEITLPCISCHTTAGWRQLKPILDFDHRQTQFPLEGQHRTVGCRSCHPTLHFKEARTTCLSCHLDLHEGQFADGCESCHTPEGWNNDDLMRMRHQATRFPLIGVHATVDCRSCHAANRYVDVPVECAGCHFELWQATLNPDHRAAGFDVDCRGCHQITNQGWVGVVFNHSDAFPLVGGHRATDCIACHPAGIFYSQTSSVCYDCHQSNYSGARNPDHTGSGFDHDCAVCHTIDGWRPAQFDHNLARFHLTGAHRSVDCAQCHINGNYTGTPADCYSCHQANYVGVGDPNHVTGGYDHICTVCHFTYGWKPADIDHNQTPFPLTGAHQTVDCTQCHTGGRFNGTSQECYSCHRTAYAGVADPNHVTGLYNYNCLICHTTDAWRPAIVNHDQTSFPLTGAHRIIECTLCHIGGRYNDTPADCYSCHQTNYDGVTDPNHVTGNYPHDCAVCHSTDGWKPAVFDHSQTPFALTGAHRIIECTLCHIGGRYNDTPTDCYSCHQANYEGVTDPNHVTGNHPHDCTVCHSTAGWKPATFDHNQSPFPLTGAHTSVECALCHAGGRFNGTPADCYSCHQANYEGVTDPNHVTGNHPHDCTVCHSTAGWKPASFDHNQSPFPLTGAHSSVECALCHVGGRFNGTSTDCYACHQIDFERVADPNHVTGQYPHDCRVCHSTTAWSPATFDHSQAGFPLTGAHVTVDCALCHVGGRFNGTPTDCYSCHQANFEGVVDPNHVTGQYLHDCAVCHSTNGWSPAIFDHSQGGFPLTGAHVDVDCALCHVGGRFNGTPTDCYSCHTNDYDNANDPDHRGAGFPTNCESCHNTNRWDDINFDHDGSWFPIYSGSHRDEWSHCSDCHPNPNNFQEFTCIGCHEHSRANANEQHNEVQNYRYASDACYECHPNGRAGDGMMLRRIERMKY